MKYEIDHTTITGDCFRISVLTERLLRLEYSASGCFTDAPTQIAVCRDFPEVPLKAREEDGVLVLETESLVLSYDGQPFSGTGLSVTLKDTGKTWHYSIVYGNSDRNLLGTARTLDMTDGFTELSSGLFGREGYAVLDDSASAVLEGEEFVSRKAPGSDLYFFGYGTDFAGGLAAFYRLCGPQPMIPRYALGNWWSRYYRYSEKSYLELLSRFREMEIPLSVAVIDMDWHVTEVDPKYGTGWTGFTWNKDLFPDPERFLQSLKKAGLAVTLNLHPADGIRAFEEMYPGMAERLGLDTASEEPAKFDLSDPAFRDAYFEEVLHPYEAQGVDFWWIDWQQGSGKEGEVDPLFLLNHYHYRDMENRGIRPMIFSRYAGPGSHRYPIGFSGDTRSTWRSLDYQPYFTSTASNIGYGWWSHDIGGHMLGDKDPERLIRWIQFGVFSPIMRIHSSASPFFNKEPWVLEEPYRSLMAGLFRLRHRLLPYLYTMMHPVYGGGLPLVRPAYYACPDSPESYEVPNEYGFGSKLLVCAVTEKMDPKLRMAKVNAYLPEGRWYDLMNAYIYEIPEGGRQRKLYRPLSELPVLLPAGGILPESLEDKENGVKNPRALRLCIGAGKDGSFTMYEDDGISLSGGDVTTTYDVSWADGTLELKIRPAKGDLSLIPDTRSYEVLVYGVEPSPEGDGTDTCCGNADFDPLRKTCRVLLPEAPVDEMQTLTLRGLTLAKNDHEARVFALLENAWSSTLGKEKVYDELRRSETPADFLKRLGGLEESEKMKDAIREIFEDGSI